MYHHSSIIDRVPCTWPGILHLAGLREAGHIYYMGFNAFGVAGLVR